MEASFEISLRIFDVPSLVAAAVAQAIAEGVDEDEACEVYSADDLDRCLVMLLDPGTLAGCEIHESTAEVQPEA